VRESLGRTIPRIGVRNFQHNLVACSLRVDLVHFSLFKMDEHGNQPAGFTRGILPWAVAVLGLLIYGVTLNRWVSFNSLGPTALALDIDWWNYQLGRPLFYLVAIPVGWLPVGWQIFGLNFLSAVFAALSLAQLARTVAILPQDRTHDQRLRIADSQALLRSPTDWLPPVFAVLVCGFQLTFWEEATVATGEMLNLLLFAFVIRCLAEYRLAQREAWLYWSVLIYGLGIANNWAMIGFLPIFGLAVLWLKGLAFFKWRFLLTGGGLMLGGMLLYLFDPLMGALDAGETTGFGQLLTWEFVNQRNPLLNMPKGRVLMLSVTAIVPLSLLAIRWPTNFGDVSGFGVALATLLTRMVHLVFLVAIVAVAFDPKFSPRALGYGLPMLTFYYLGALMVGYLAGYFLLICGTQPVKRWEQATGIGRLVNLTLLGALWLGVVAVPVLLLRKNLPVVRVENSDLLRRYVGQVANGLPQDDVLLLGTDQRQLLLLATHFHGQGGTRLLAPIGELAEPRFHVRAAAAYPGKWPAPEGADNSQKVSAAAVMQFLSGMQTGFPLWSVDPLYGELLLESAVATPRGQVYELQPLTVEPAATADGLTAEIDTIKALVEQLRGDIATGARTATAVAGLYSGWVNTLGVRLQIGGQNDLAAWAFETALSFNTNNLSALINRDVNVALGTNGPGISPAVAGLDKEVAEARSWPKFLRQNGPVDEANVRSYYGRRLLAERLSRQAVEHLQRSVELDGTNITARLALADAQVQLRRYPAARQTLADSEISGAAADTEELARLLSLIDFGTGDRVAAVKRLRAGLAKHETSTKLRRTLADVYLSERSFTNALPVLEELVKLAPKDRNIPGVLASVYGEVGRLDDALKLFDEQVSANPKNPTLLVNRGSVLLRAQKTDLAQADYDLALELEPRLMRGHVGLADVALLRGDTNAAIGRLEKAMGMTAADSAAAQRIQRHLDRLRTKQ
jgi:tetratricopeptide (TPR) repeat protein